MSVKGAGKGKGNQLFSFSVDAGKRKIRVIFLRFPSTTLTLDTKALSLLFSSVCVCALFRKTHYAHYIYKTKQHIHPLTLGCPLETLLRVTFILRKKIEIEVFI